MHNKLVKFNRLPVLILLFVGLTLGSAGINRYVEKNSISQTSPDLNVEIVEIGYSEIQLVAPVSETPIPIYHLNSSRMFTILYLRMNFTGTSSVDGIQLSGQPTIIVDGSVYPIRSRYNDFNMFLTLDQGTHIISLLNIGVSGTAGAYQMIFSHLSFIVQVGLNPSIPTLSPYRTSFDLNVSYDPNLEFYSDQAHLDRALVSPTTFEGTYSFFNAPLKEMVLWEIFQPQVPSPPFPEYSSFRQLMESVKLRIGE